MILCVCLSPAVDITYRVPALATGATNRVQAVTHRAGGKAVNVARVLHDLGEPVYLIAPTGGDTGHAFADDLAAAGLPAELVADAAPTRRTVTIVDGSGAEPTVFVEPAAISDWPGLLVRIESALRDADAVVVSGVVPAGAPDDALSTLVGAARAAGHPIVVDTSGAPLRDALTARPTAVKPNRHELEEITGDRDPLRGSMTLARTYGVAVLTSLGADGVIAVEGAQAWQARPARPLTGNPTGAGDALVAGLARGLAKGSDLAAVLTDCVALSAAAVLTPHAGEVAPGNHAEQLRGVTVQALSP